MKFAVPSTLGMQVGRYVCRQVGGQVGKQVGCFSAALTGLEIYDQF